VCTQICSLFLTCADLEQVLSALSTAAAQGQQITSVQVSLYPSLLRDAKTQQGVPAAGAAKDQQQLACSQQHAQPAAVNIQDAKTWEVSPCEIVSQCCLC
jgi:hypothetical protein